MCAEKFPSLVCRPVAAQFTKDNLIALFEIQQQDDELRVVSEKHYRLVDPSQLSPSELDRYRRQSEA